MSTANLLQLATFLDTVPKHKFDMWTFRTKGSSDLSLAKVRDDHVCGTAGCAVGYGPQAGFPILRTDLDWLSYSERVFGVEWEGDDWDFLFGAEWKDIDNTPTGAAKRIRFYIKNGLPESWEGYPTKEMVEAYQ